MTSHNYRDNTAIRAGKELLTPIKPSVHHTSKNAIKDFLISTGEASALPYQRYTKSKVSNVLIKEYTTHFSNDPREIHLGDGMKIVKLPSYEKNTAKIIDSGLKVLKSNSFFPGRSISDLQTRLLTVSNKKCCWTRNYASVHDSLTAVFAHFTSLFSNDFDAISAILKDAIKDPTISNLKKLEKHFENSANKQQEVYMALKNLETTLWRVMQLSSAEIEFALKYTENLDFGQDGDDNPVYSEHLVTKVFKDAFLNHLLTTSILTPEEELEDDIESERSSSSESSTSEMDSDSISLFPFSIWRVNQGEEDESLEVTADLSSSHLAGSLAHLAAGLATSFSSISNDCRRAAETLATNDKNLLNVSKKIASISLRQIPLLLHSKAVSLSEIASSANGHNAYATTLYNAFHNTFLSNSLSRLDTVTDLLSDPLTLDLKYLVKVKKVKSASLNPSELSQSEGSQTRYSSREQETTQRSNMPSYSASNSIAVR